MPSGNGYSYKGHGTNNQVWCRYSFIVAHISFPRRISFRRLGHIKHSIEATGNADTPTCCRATTTAPVTMATDPTRITTPTRKKDLDHLWGSGATNHLANNLTVMDRTTTVTRTVALTTTAAVDLPHTPRPVVARTRAPALLEIRSEMRGGMPERLWFGSQGRQSGECSLGKMEIQEG